MTTAQRRVRSHTRVGANGRRQRVRSHRRSLQPARAGRNLSLAWHSIRRGQYGRAALVAGAAAAEVAGWLAFRGFGIAAVTVGIGATAAGVSAIRATKTPKPVRESRLLTAGPDHERRQKRTRGGTSPYELGKRHGEQDRATNWKGPFADTPTYGDGDPRSAEYEKGYSEGAGYGWQG